MSLTKDNQETLDKFTTGLPWMKREQIQDLALYLGFEQLGNMKATELGALCSKLLVKKPVATKDINVPVVGELKSNFPESLAGVPMSAYSNKPVVTRTRRSKEQMAADAAAKLAPPLPPGKYEDPITGDVKNTLGGEGMPKAPIVPSKAPKTSSTEDNF
jgi:hypothetical protein